MDHTQIEQIFLALTLFLLLAKLFGELALRLKQPALLGELAAGMLIGPGLLGRFIINSPIQNSEALSTIAELGAVFFFFIIGYSEVDLRQLKRIANKSLVASLPNVILSFVFGYIIGMIWNYSIMASLFIGLALSLTLLA